MFSETNLRNSAGCRQQAKKTKGKAVRVFEIVLMIKGESVKTYKEAESEQAINAMILNSSKIPAVVSCRPVSETLETLIGQ